MITGIAETVTYTVADLMNRYKIKQHTAYKIMREIRAYNNSVLPVGRCLVEEAIRWERRNLNEQAEPLP